MPFRPPSVGELRTRITIQKLTEGRDESQGLTETWTAWAYQWALVQPISGREYFQAFQINAAISHRVVIRHLPDVTSAMRVVLGDEMVVLENRRVLRIHSVIDPDERHRWLELMCEEAV
jgi:SPP1 family predicted phage head-tail adaptor